MNINQLNCAWVIDLLLIRRRWTWKLHCFERKKEIIKFKLTQTKSQRFHGISMGYAHIGAKELSKLNTLTHFKWIVCVSISRSDVKGHLNKKYNFFFRLGEREVGKNLCNLHDMQSSRTHRDTIYFVCLRLGLRKFKIRIFGQCF